MKPIIGICANYTKDESIGLKTGLGLQGQEWQLLADDYVNAIERAGGVPVILPITENTHHVGVLLDRIDGVLFSGGTDIDPQYYGQLPQYGLGALDPDRDRYELNLVKKVLYETELPVLGICRGIQLLNVATGGTIYQDLQKGRSASFNHTVKDVPRYHGTHKAYIKKQSTLHAIFQKDAIDVNSFHHQAIDQLGDGFEMTMSSSDELAEGIEWTGNRFVIGVQYHPEMMISRYPEHLCLFDAFIDHCQRKD